MDNNRIIEISKKIKNINVGIYGDICLDAYWIMNPKGSEISAETNLKGEAVKNQNYYLGGAGNVIANLATLSPKSVKAIGIIGDDIFGREVIRQLKEINISTENIIIQKNNFNTRVFGKRYLFNKEESRIDFGFYNKISKNTIKKILNSVHKILSECDVFIFNQQVPQIYDDDFFKNLNEIFSSFNEKVILVDSRNYSDKFKNACLKLNKTELNNTISKKKFEGYYSNSDFKILVKELFNKIRKPIFVTIGQHGVIGCDEQGIFEVMGIELLKDIDAVGAGDTFVSSIALCMASGETPESSAIFGNLAASVSVQKLMMAGTASIEEILNLNSNVNYIYNIELAEDIRKARYYSSSKIEVCYDRKKIPLGKIKHAVFDNDGTISTLRQGWESIMEEVMIKSILGDKYYSVKPDIFSNVTEKVRNYIDKSTGILTILQMEALADIVLQSGFILREKILNKFEYKEIYNKAILKLVDERIRRINLGELDKNDFIIKGSIRFLELLREKGFILYLVSGTDLTDVLRESKELGYDYLFNGGIFGA
ncbi:MAG: PfkB family carbohydrate kinase, partial [Actinobacteria bacterium]|nr:PfkB family carbohydrate kinase [Actinomycetota bacterium]